MGAPRRSDKSPRPDQAGPGDIGSVVGHTDVELNSCMPGYTTGSGVWIFAPETKWAFCDVIQAPGPVVTLPAEQERDPRPEPRRAMHDRTAIQKSIAVIGTGISGMAAAWLLSQRHKVTVYECDRRIGGHSNTVTVKGVNGEIAVDTGFIVYNELTYPNLTALFEHFEVPTQLSDMSFAVSLANGDLEYSGNNFAGLFAEKRNLLRPRFWSMLRDLQRFYREAPRDLALLQEFHTTLGDYLDAGAYGAAFRNDHLLPMAAAVWSAPKNQILNYPAASFIRFHDSHGLLRLRNRPPWRTVTGGSRAYIERLTRSYKDRIRLAAGVAAVHRNGAGVKIRDANGAVETFDDVVIASHADQALAMLDNPTPDERRLLGAFRYSRNLAVLHSDPALMPKRRAVWSSWNHIGTERQDTAQDNDCPTVTYWMNSLQGIPHDTPLFVTLNPQQAPRDQHCSEIYEHPLFDSAAISAQSRLWSLQGRRNTWFCGAYFGAGFHEDGLQAGLAVAEALGGGRRPWTVANESGRIALDPLAAPELLPPPPVQAELAA
jgi:predicted NAD/FAD-binding protein